MADAESVGLGLGLRDLKLKFDYDHNDRPRDTFYVPTLRVSDMYWRVAGYFRSSSFEAVADEGITPFLTNGGTIRMIAHAELTEEDVEAVRAGQDLAEQVGHAHARQEWEDGSLHLALVGQLVAIGALEIKVVVSTTSDGIPTPPGHPARTTFHGKSGVMRDGFGDMVAFKGSNNETVSGWTRNWEDFSVYRSWDTIIWDAYGDPVVQRFQRLWRHDAGAGWQVFDLQEADRERLVEYCARYSAEHDIEWDDPERVGADIDGDDHEPAVHPVPEVPVKAGGPVPVDLEGVDRPGIRSAPVDPWPHQDATVEAAYDTVEAVLTGQPVVSRGRMFSDEVGLGKTIEVALTVREALVQGTARRVLLLVPAAVIGQWQDELWEKAGLWVPRLAGRRVIWPDGEEAAVPADPWESFDVLLATSHLARLTRNHNPVLDAGWDILVVDEAHHARRKEANKPGTANLLMQFLRKARDYRTAVGTILLATATPMQMHVHEAGDLLGILGMPESWQGDRFGWFYREFKRKPDDRDWEALAVMVAESIATYGHDEMAAQALRVRFGTVQARDIVQWHEMADTSKARRWDDTKRAALDQWMRLNSPLRRLVLRSTRQLLRDYQAAGIIDRDVIIPVRHPEDMLIPMPPAEQQLYDRIETWIRDHHEAAKVAGNVAAGFIMTVYRRRLTSSLQAIRQSLSRRVEAMRQQRRGGQLALQALLDTDDQNQLDDDPDDQLVDASEASLAELVADLDDEIDHLEGFISDIDHVLESHHGTDSKFRRLEQDLNERVLSGQHRTAIIFTQYADTMHWIRDLLARTIGPQTIACYSGVGGQMWNPEASTWDTVPKTTVKEAFRDAATNPSNPLRILIGTDSMSEGLNLQTCNLLYNYDLPWNFMRVEQRIGRIDRIGATHPDANIVNLILDGTIETQIHTGIGGSHGSFTEVVGSTGAVIEQAIKNAALGGRELPDVIDQLTDEIAKARNAALTIDDFNSDGLLTGDNGVWTFDRADVPARTRLALEIDPRTEPAGDDTWTLHDDREWTITHDPARATGSVSLYGPTHPAAPTQ